MSEEVVTTEETPETEADIVVTEDEKGEKRVSLAALKEERTQRQKLAARVKELEPVAARVTDIDARLNAAAPILEAIQADPTLQAAVNRYASGTRQSAETTEQPEDDPDAELMAEVWKLYTTDGQLDIARARRALSITDKRSAKQTDDRMRPLAGTVLSAKAESNLARALAATDADGVPLASRESLMEVVADMPPALMANERVVDLLLDNAIGKDRRKGRTPKAPDEPLYLDTAGGPGRRESVLTADERAFITKHGISEKDYRQSSSNLEKNINGRGGIPLGGKS